MDPKAFEKPGVDTEKPQREKVGDSHITWI
jgi:hypothetical protein